MNSSENLMLAARAVGGLVVVLVLVALSARIAKRTRHFGNGDGLRVVERIGLSRDAQLVVVEAAGRQLLLGIGPSGVRMLTHLDDQWDDAEPAFAAVAPEPVATPAAEPARIPVVEQIFGPAPVVRAEPGPEPEPGPGSEPEPELEPEPEQLPETDVVQVPTQRRGRRAKDTPVDQGTQPMTRAQLRAMERAQEQEESPTSEAAEPAAADPPADDRVHVPPADYNGYPDLASALRAMGRTMDPPSEPADADALPSGEGAALQALPTQRQSPETDLSHATSSAPRPHEDEDPDEPAGKRDQRRRRVVAPRQPQASGSVLSPATWRQGIEALREMTARRG